MFDKIGFGTWQFGGRVEADPNNEDEKDILSIKNAINAGIKHIDTAELYANGKCEELVGQAIKDYNREDLFIASKVRDVKLNYDDILKNCEASLKRLGVSRLDLYYVHRPNPNIPISYTAKAFNRLLDEGMIKNVGISNASVQTLMEYQNHLNKPIFATQSHYNLIVRECVKKGVLDYCIENNIKFIAYRPIQLAVPSLGIEFLAKRGVYKLLDEIADKYQKTNAQIAVKWVISKDNVHTIFKTSNPIHLKETLEVLNFEMGREDIENLTNNFPLQKDEGFVSSGPFPLV
ncbi:MAG: General stress protein 69 [Alphaproteobacteria bacterium ADurb.Bin438]|nr:MAG: General stress protein 69 [Alphaproteobacteria bacterium ADurb.Bin438]